MEKWTTVETKNDLTDEIKDMIEGAVEGWIEDSADDHLERVEGTTLNDGTRLDFGTTTDAPGYRAALAYARRVKREMME